MKLLNRSIGVILLLCFLLLHAFWLIGNGNYASFFLYQKPHKVSMEAGNFQLHIFRLLDGYPGVCEYVISGYTDKPGILTVRSNTSVIFFNATFEMQDIHCSLLNDGSLIAESSELVFDSDNQPNEEIPPENSIISFELVDDLLYIEKSYGFLLPDVNGHRWIEDIPVRCYWAACAVYCTVSLLLFINRKRIRN